MPAVRGIFVLVLVALLWWVIRLPRERVRPSDDTGAAGQGWSSNLKLWAGVALGLQILIYLLF